MLMSRFIKNFLVLIYLITSLSCTRDQEEVVSTLPDDCFLNIPTYDGSGEVVHPDIIEMSSAFQYKYYLAFTPYPYPDNKKENPSILVSNNGYDFIEQVNGMNPIVNEPQVGYNNDPDFIYDKFNQEFLLTYQETVLNDCQKIVFLKSKDGVEWREVGQIDQNHYGSDIDDFSVSPTLVQTDSSIYLFIVNLSSSTDKINFLMSDNGEDWDYNDKHTINFNASNDFQPWHIDIVTGDNKYYMLISGYYNDWSHQDLYLATSEDLLNWDFQQEPIIKHSEVPYNLRSMYRSTGLVQNDSLAIWFSYIDNDTKYRMAFQKVPLN